MTAWKGRAGFAQQSGEGVDLALHEQSGHGRQEVGDALRGGVRAMRRAEGVVHVEVGEARRATPRTPDRSPPRRRGSAGSRAAAGRRGAACRPPPGRPGRARRPSSAPAGRGAGSAALRPAAGAAGRRSCPSGRPRWLARMTDAPRSRRLTIVGRLARMRVSSVIRPSSSGTLRSARTKTRACRRHRRRGSVLASIGARLRAARP